VSPWICQKKLFNKFEKLRQFFERQFRHYFRAIAGGEKAAFPRRDCLFSSHDKKATRRGKRFRSRGIAATLAAFQDAKNGGLGAA